MAAALLTRDALRRVLQSLITATRQTQSPGLAVPRGPWDDGLLLGEGDAPSLGCDSLDLLQIATAVNELFHLHEAHLEAELLHGGTFGGWLDLVQEAWQRGVAQITVTTSGSSGHPKACPHLFTALQLEVDYLATLFPHTARVVAFTPAHHVYGLLFTAMLPDRLGVPVQDILQSTVRGDADARPGLQSGDLVVSFPEGWSWILQNLRPLPPGVAGVVLREAIAGKTGAWGVLVQAVEIRDVTLPPNLQDAMSRQAQAEREKSARVTLASAERLVAVELEEASRTYDRSPTALQILQINRIYEMNKDRGATILIPTSMAEAMSRVLDKAGDPASKLS